MNRRNLQHGRHLSRIVGAGLMAFACAAGAQGLGEDDDTGFYLAVSVNRLSADFEDRNDVSFEDSDTTGGIRGGFMFNDFVGVELGYIDLGDYSAIGEVVGNDIQVDADAFSAAAVFNFTPTPTVDLYAKLGAYFVEANSDSRIGANVLRAGDDTTEAFAAFGAELDLGELNFFAEISKIDTDVNDLTTDIISLGIKYEFGY